MTIIDEITSEFLWGRYRAAMEISFFRSCVKDIVNDLAANTCHQEIALIAARAIQEYEAAETRIRRYEQFGWDRWRFVLLRLRARLVKKQEDAVLTFLNLKGSSMAPFHLTTPQKCRAKSRRSIEKEQRRMIERVRFLIDRH